MHSTFSNPKHPLLTTLIKWRRQYANRKSSPKKNKFSIAPASRQLPLIPREDKKRQVWKARPRSKTYFLLSWLKSITEWMRFANLKSLIQISKSPSSMLQNSISSNLVPKLLHDIICDKYDLDQWCIFKGEIRVLTPRWIFRRMLWSILMVIDLKSWKSPSK
jgi:hypothetical protein